MNSKSKSFGAESELMLTWRLNNHFGLVGSLRYLLGTIGTDTTTSEGTYYSFVSNRMTDRSFRFAIGFNYYMQGKNFKYRNKKTLQSTESGIKL